MTKRELDAICDRLITWRVNEYNHLQRLRKNGGDAREMASLAGLIDGYTIALNELCPRRARGDVDKSQMEAEGIYK